MKIGETIELFKTKDGELRDFLSAHEKESEENQVDQQIEPKAALFKQSVAPINHQLTLNW